MTLRADHRSPNSVILSQRRRISCHWPWHAVEEHPLQLTSCSSGMRYFTPQTPFRMTEKSLLQSRGFVPSKIEKAFGVP